MITISPIKNSAGAAIYFSKEDNYYLSEVDTKETSMWWGIGADKLDLSGKKVTEKDLQKLLEGTLSNGVIIGLQKDGSIKHRAGYDLGFHAPKSVSILALDGGDKRFYDAHLEAVKETLKTIEKDCAQAKIFKGKKISFENTKNLTVALIRHAASRALDPHLHHHALVMNATERQDKAWRALASSMTKTNNKTDGFLERVYNNQIYYGLIYRSTLANKVQALGCEIEIVGKHGMWEIKGIPEIARETLSKRRKEIEKQIGKLNYYSLKAADIVSLDTRENKPKNIRLEEIQQTWKAELAKVGFSSKEFLAEIKNNKNKKLTADQELQKSESITKATKTVKDAAWYLSQYKLKLDYVKIISQALEFSIGKTTHRDIVYAVNQMVKDGFLIPLDKSDTTFVTKELIETEKTIIELVDNSKNKWSEFALKDRSFNNATDDKIKKHAVDILQSKHRLSLVESGKSDNKDFIANVLELAESSGKTVRVLSPNRLIANDINENITRRKPDNLWQWLISLGKPEIGESVAGFKHKYKEEVELPQFLLRFKQGKDVIIVNNTETLGCNDTKTILELTEKSKAKVIFLRDMTDKRGFGAGNPIETLKQAGIERFKLDFSESEKTQHAQKASSVVPELKVIKDNNKRTLALAKEYAQKEDEDKSKDIDKGYSNTVVLVASKEQLKATNEAIRKELKEKGKISDLEYSISVLNLVYMSKPEAILAHKYQKNMVIRIYGKGTPDDWNVGYSDRETNILRLVQNKRTMLWNPKKQVDRVKHAVFKKETLQITKGDKLIATSNMHDLGIKNGSKFTIGEINDKHVELLYDVKNTRKTKNTKDINSIENTKKTKIKLAELKDKHFQYDYATTINSSLKKPVNNIIADFKAYSLDKSTIDELTKRAKENLTIFTNDAKTAQKRFGYIPVKLTAAETLLDDSETIASNTPTLSSGNETKRTLSDKTIFEIKTDLEKAIGVLRDQYDFRSQVERKAVEFALEKITSRDAGFDNKDLEKEALEYALKELIAGQNKEVTIEDIKKVIEEKRASGELVTGSHFENGISSPTNVLTTKKILELERSIIDSLKKGENKLTSLIDPKTLKIPTEGINLTNDQKNAISLITTTKDQYVIVQGYAGTGKTAMFSQVHKMLKEENKNNNNKKEKIKMLGLAPTHKAVKELKAIGIKAQSLKSFLIAQQRIERNQEEQKNQIDIGNKTPNPKINILDNKLIVLDEFSMVPNKDLVEFDKIIKKSKAHTVLSGDMAQHLPIGSGKPVETIQKSNILKTAFLKEIVRQKNPNIKEAVKSTINKDYAYALDKIEQENPQNHIERINPKSDLLKNQSDLDFDFFKNLKKSVIEIDNNKLQPGEKTLEEMVAEDFLTRTPEVRDDTVIIVHANEDRAVITKFIRDGLKKQGVIEKDGIRINRLTAKGVTDAEYKSLQSYSTGNVVRFGNKYYNVIEIDLEARSLLLKDGADKTRCFYPEKEADRYNMELYTHTKEELAIGDVIRLTKTDKKRGLFANFEYRVNEINDKQVMLESKDRDEAKNKNKNKNKEKTPIIILNHRKLKDSHWDYAQTVTSYGIQGGSKKFAINFAVSYREFLANVRSFYIGVSRAIEHLVIYTNNKYSLLAQILKNKGEKYSALEVVGELDGPNNIEKNKQLIKEKINAEFYNVKEIKQSLESQAEIVIERLLGSPNDKLSSSTQWRYGNKGSLAISMIGSKRGLWRNFETGESGNLITLLQKEMTLIFPETLKYASDVYGSYQSIIPSSKTNKNLVDIGSHSISTKTNDERNEKNKTSEYAQKLAKESLPITGTIVEKYLKENRGINNIDVGDIRYHPKVFTGKTESQKYLPAMLSIGRDKDGNIQCVQATYLNPKTANKADLTVKKRTYASPTGALVSLQKQKHENTTNNVTSINDVDKISFIAEGTETGMSIKEAVADIKNSEVVVTLGKSNFTSIDPQAIGQKVVFCLDNDGPKTLTDDTVHKAAKRLINFGKEVFIAVPEPINNEKSGKTKIDFNDMAKITGVNTVKSTIENSIPYEEWKNSVGKNTIMKENEINLSIAGNVMQKDRYITNSKLYESLLKKPEIDLPAAIKFIDSEQKNTLTKHLSAYNRIQNIPTIQKNINTTKKLNIHDTQKFLSKTEKEIY